METKFMIIMSYHHKASRITYAIVYFTSSFEFDKMYYSLKFLEQGKNDIEEETVTKDLTNSDPEKKKMFRKEKVVFTNGTCKNYP